MNFKNDWGLPSEDPSQNLSNNSMLPSENQEKSGGVQNLTEPKTILEAAHAYCNAGLSVIPTGHDKVPLGPWKQYQNKAADEATRNKIFANPKATCLSIVAGRVSGNLEILDFDNKGELIKPFAAEVRKKALDLLKRLVWEKSQSGGGHVAYRCPDVEIPGSKKLAKKYVEAPDEKEIVINGKKYKPRKYRAGWFVEICLIETRGEGGYCLVAPSPGYEPQMGCFSNLPIITPEERQILMDAAKFLDCPPPGSKKDDSRGSNKQEKKNNEIMINGKYVPIPEWARNTSTGNNLGSRIGDRFNENGDIGPTLEKHGWACIGNSIGEDGHTIENYRRPGKEEGNSASLLDGKVFHCFSTNAPPFEEGESYNLFSTYTLLEFNGDFKAAAKKLGELEQTGSFSDNVIQEKDVVEQTNVYHGWELQEMPKVEQTWEKPVPLEEPQVPKLEDDLLPGTLGEITRAVSTATETPLELAAGLVLPVVATACQGKIVVQIKPGYQEPLCFWTVTVLDSGSRKSAVLTKTTAPLNEWEKRKRLEIKPLQREALARQKNQESRIKALRTRYNNPRAGNLETIAAEIIELEKNPIEVPNIPQLWAQDVTPEHLGTLMNNNKEKMSILSAEGGIFDILGGRYNNGLSNLDLFLQSHSGDSVRVDRGSRDPVYLDKPALSLGLSPQPDVLRSLGDKQGFRGRGLLARFQYLLPKSNLGYRKLTSEAIPEETERKYQNLIYMLLDIELAENEIDGPKVPYILKLSRKAYDRWFDFSIEVEKDLREGGRFEHITDWAGKFPGMTARIAGLLHCAENPDQPWKSKISAETMERSIKLASFFSEHALVAFKLIGSDKTFVQAQKIWRWVERNKHQTFSKRDCFNALKGSFHRVAKMDDPLSILHERNYIKGSTKKTGGRPSIVFDVNPEFIEGWI